MVSSNCFASSLKGLLALAVSLVLAACGDETLYSALGEQQANEVQAALIAGGIGARKAPVEGGAFAVRVAPADIPGAMSVLRALGLPRVTPANMGEVFSREGLIASPTEERARYLYALSQELSATLMQIEGVVSARVHVALPERDSLTRERATQASVAVVIIHRDDVSLAHYETDIKAIVTDGIEGMDDVNRVTVKFFPRSRPALVQPPAGGGALSGVLLWLAARRRRG